MDPKREALDDVVGEVDRVGLVVLLVDPQCSDARRVVNCCVLEASYLGPAQGEIAGFVGVTENITEIVALREELRALSLTDELTRLYNPRGFRILAETQVALEERRGSRSTGVALLSADMDGPKGVNDTYGHEAGDAAVVEFAKVILMTCRETDIPARTGGDEFPILLVDCEPGSENDTASRLTEAIASFNRDSVVPWELAASIGAARMSHAGDATVEGPLRAADEGMYVVKAQHNARSRVEPEAHRVNRWRPPLMKA